MERLCYLRCARYLINFFSFRDILSDVRAELKRNVSEVAMLNQQQQYQERLLFEFIHRVISVIRKLEKNKPFKLSNA